MRPKEPMNTIAPLSLSLALSFSFALSAGSAYRILLYIFEPWKYKTEYSVSFFRRTLYAHNELHCAAFYLLRVPNVRFSKAETVFLLGISMRHCFALLSVASKFCVILYYFAQIDSRMINDLIFMEFPLGDRAPQILISFRANCNLISNESQREQASEPPNRPNECSAPWNTARTTMISLGRALDSECRRQTTFRRSYDVCCVYCFAVR